LQFNATQEVDIDTTIPAAQENASIPTTHTCPWNTIHVTARLIKLRNEKRVAYYEYSKLRKEEGGKEAGMLRPAI
jgi:hypothetical protein